MGGVSNLNYCNAILLWKKLLFLSQDASNIPDTIIEKLFNEQIELGDDMHLVQLSNCMLIVATWTPSEITAKYISQLGSLLSLQDIGHYQLNHHDKFMELVIEHWQKTYDIIQDTVVITKNEVNQFKEHNLKSLRIIKY